MKRVLILILSAFAEYASAACWSNTNQIPPGTPPMFLVNGMWCTTQVPQLLQGIQNAPQVTQTVIVNRIPDTHAYRSCTTEEVVVRSGLLTIAGAVSGALIGNSSRAAGVGGGLGLLYSTTGACRVAVPLVLTQGTVTVQGFSEDRTNKLSSGWSCPLGSYWDGKGCFCPTCR